jgi:hypothetical protein
LSSLSSCLDNDAAEPCDNDDWEPLPLHHALDIPSPTSQEWSETFGVRRVSATTTSLTFHNVGNMDDSIASGTSLDASLSPIAVTTVWNPFAETITDEVVPTEIVTNDWPYFD